MENSWQFNLTPGFAQQLMDDGFQYVGHYEILEGNVCKIRVDKEAGRWRFSVYTHVSYADGGKHVRIGKSEGLLRDRLNSWPRYIGNALKFTMRKNQQFKGGTPPWEAQGWVEYTVPYGGRGAAVCTTRREFADVRGDEKGAETSGETASGFL